MIVGSDVVVIVSGGDCAHERRPVQMHKTKPTAATADRNPLPLIVLTL